MVVLEVLFYLFEMVLELALYLVLTALVVVLLILVVWKWWGVP